jgi:hypothetical protein
MGIPFNPRCFLIWKFRCHDSVQSYSSGKIWVP